MTTYYVNPCTNCGEATRPLFNYPYSGCGDMCRPCWDAQWEYGRRHVAEAWEDEDGNPLPEPTLIGNPEAAKIETYWACLNSGEQFWQWRLSTPGASFGLGWSAPEYTTEAAAVAAAREALAPRFEVERSGMAGKYGVARERWRYRLNGKGPWHGSYRLESEAIAAARAALGVKS